MRDYIIRLMNGVLMIPEVDLLEYLEKKSKSMEDSLRAIEECLACGALKKLSLQDGKRREVYYVPANVVMEVRNLNVVLA